MIRITGGKFKGKRLQTLPIPELRPASDMVRQAVFNMIMHADWSPGLEGKSVLDMCCGTAAYALEALSRGAASAICVDYNRHILNLARENLQSCDMLAQARVLNGDLLKPPLSQTPVDWVFCDPPYDMEAIPSSLLALHAAGWIGDDTIIALETRAKHAPETEPFKILSSRRYGTTLIRFLQI